MYTDFNEYMDGMCFILHYQGKPLQEQMAELGLTVGDEVVLYQDEDDFEVTATLDFSYVNRLGRHVWVARPHWPTINYFSPAERRKRTTERLDAGLADRLISELLANPADFRWGGGSLALARQFVLGFPIDKLRALLRHEHPEVLRTAIWIVNDLQDEGVPALNEVIPLSRHPDSQVRISALAAVRYAAKYGHPDEFFRIVEAMDDPEPYVAEAAIGWVAAADAELLQAALPRLQEERGSPQHLDHLGLLLDAQSTDPSIVESMLSANDPQRRRYGLAMARGCTS
jgi:hypothetical protein